MITRNETDKLTSNGTNKPTSNGTIQRTVNGLPPRPVIPAQAGSEVHYSRALDFRLRGSDKEKNRQGRSCRMGVLFTNVHQYILVTSP